MKQIWVAPGNAGTALETKTKNIAIEPTDVNALLQFAQQERIDLTIVGPETALAAGIVDAFQKVKLPIFGPTQHSARLETSKAFCKDFLKRHSIPTARFATFTDVNAALNYLETQTLPIVIKASGLAAGKGVIIANTKSDAKNTIRSMLQENQFGHAGKEIVIEEFLQGEELSFIVMIDGKNALALASSQDHKRLEEGDRGPNTGGMGAYSPVPRMTTELHDKIMTQIIRPTLAGLHQENNVYSGFLYAGLMITENNEPQVLEFNVRLGDPETQPILMRLKSDLVTLIQAALRGELDQTSIEWDKRKALGVVLASKGYPAHYEKGDTIDGLNKMNDPDVKVFHAGTQLKNNLVLTNGGRVLTVTALGDTFEMTKQKAYAAAQQIHWPHCYYRRDIGSRARD